MKYWLYSLMESETNSMKVKNIYCPVCHRRTCFTGRVVHESERTQVVEWKCAECGVILKST
jgi:RNase P subunit RPR2